MPQPNRRSPHFAGRLLLLAGLLALVTACEGAPSSIETIAPSADQQASNPARPDFSSFAAQWGGHGRGLTVQPDGRFEITMRTYRWCDEGPPPCDTLNQDSVIISGTRAEGTLETVSGNVATGKVNTSTDPGNVPIGPVTFTLDPANHSLAWGDIVFCGDNAPAGFCGA